MTKYALGWYPGSSAQIELFRPEQSQGGNYQLKYTSPMRPTLRPPSAPYLLGPAELDPINESLDALAAAQDSGRGDGDPDPAAAAEPAPPMSPPARAVTAEMVQRMAVLGDQLFVLLIPAELRPDLRVAGAFLELGVDEMLLGYPWELMHDGEEFLCLKHNLGRFVNARQGVGGGPARATAPGSGSDLSVLIISVAKPNARGGGLPYRELPQVQAETMAVVAALQAQGIAATLLAGQAATYDAVVDALKRHYDIIHFAGHGSFNQLDPGSSSIALWDKDMRANAIRGFFGRSAPTFCFINACESARVTGGPGAPAAPLGWKERYDIFGIGRALLETGSYLLGSRWPIGDTPAAAFAAEFYTQLLTEKPLGEVVRLARGACQKASSGDDMAWASYVFYGDPRVRFNRV